jgi:hypothetical protein
LLGSVFWRNMLRHDDALHRCRLPLHHDILHGVIGD